MDEKESLVERRDNELEALQAIYMDDFHVIQKKREDLLKVVLKLTPLQSMREKGVHAKVELVLEYTPNYPNQSPIISLQNAVGVSKDDVQKLKTHLQCEAAEHVGEVMAHHLAYLVQTFLHSHNIPRLSFYDEMMTNKKREEERVKAKELQQRLEQQEADKLITEDEARQIQEELLRREEMMRESRKKRSTLLGDRDQDESIAQNIKTRNVETSSNKDSSFSQKRPTSQTAGKFEGPISNSWRRRRNSSESSESHHYTGNRKITFFNKGEHLIHCGKCLGQGQSGCLVFGGLDTTTGDFVTVREWKLVGAVSASKAVKTLQWADTVGQDMAGKVMKQVTTIEQEITSLMARISHPHLVQFLAVKATNTQAHVTLQILEEYVGGANMEMQLRPGGVPVELLRQYTYQMLDALWFLHGKSVVHKDLKLSNCWLDSSGDIKLANYSVGKRLCELDNEFGAGRFGTVQNTNTSSRTGKKGDIYDMGLVVLSLLRGEIVTAADAEIPTTVPDDLHDLLSKSLCSGEKERLSAYQLLQHPFVTPQSSHGFSNGGSENSSKVGLSPGLSSSSPTDTSEPQAPIPEFTFFSGIPGKSRINSEFEQLEFLGKGGFGNVIKVRNKLDDGLYAIKRIPWNPKNTNLNRKITREVQLISRLNHENVVRYYNSWLEVAEESDLPSESEESLSDQVNNAVLEVQNSEDLLLKLNRFEPPSAVQDDSKQDDDSWCRNDVDDNNKASDSSSEDDAPYIPSHRSLPKGSFFSSKPGGSSEGIVFTTNSAVEESMLQFGDLLDSEYEDSDDEEMASAETSYDMSLQYLYIQMEYCEKSTLRYLIDEGLYRERDKVWRLIREIVEGLAHIHSQGIIHRDLKPVNLFLDADGHIKIGDFGLATTHGRGEPTLDVHALIENTASPDGKEGSTTAEGMTGKVGTVLYVAPELATGSGRLKYSQKVDLYSLGIIFFEMCYRPLETGMERVKMLGNIRTNKIKFPDDFDKKRLAKESVVLNWLLQHDPTDRPTSQELLQSHYIPPKLEDHQLDEVLKHTLASTNSTRYRRLMTAMFSQTVTPVFDVTYDIEILKTAYSTRTVLAQQFVHETLKVIFTRHGALRIRTPLMMPRTPTSDTSESTASVVDHSGGVVTLPYDLRLPFARYIARSNVMSVKRFDIGCVYRDRKFLGAHPKELYECAFDIVSPTTEGNVPDAEVLFSIAEIIREFPCLNSRNYFIQMNHAGLLKAVLTSYGVPAERHQEFFKILQESQTERLRNKQLNELLEGVQISEHAISALYGFLYFEGPVEKVKEHIIGVLKKRTQSSADARQALQELQSVVSHCATFDVKLTICIKTTLVYNIQHFSGIIFQVVATDNRKLKRGGVDILAAGGRYDQLIAYFRHGTDAVQCPGGVGASIAVEKIVSAVCSDKEINLPSTCDVLVCTACQTSMLTERMRIVRELWAAGICATLMYGSPAQLTLEDIQDYCKQSAIPHLVFLKEQDPGVVKVVSIEKDKVTKSTVPVKDLIEHLQAKISSRTEATESTVPNAKLLNNPGTSENSSSPDIQVSFTTQDRLQWNIKKRYESQMMARIGPVVQQIRQHINSKSGVEVIGVDLPGSVVKSLAASLDLEGNEDAFEHSVSTVTDKHARYAKAISRVCNEVRDLKVAMKLPIIFVYSVKDELYRIFV